MFYTEAYKERQDLESALMNRWDKALNADGGIDDEHLARTTAILCENYLRELKNDARLIAEDRVQTGTFRGVNLALLGLITRVIPNLVGAELVGVQAMPTPKAPIFTMTWHKDTTKGLTAGKTGTYPNYTSDGDEMWVTPIDTNAQFGGVDPYYSSNEIYEKKLETDVGNDYELAYAADLVSNGTKGYIFPDSVVAYLFAADADVGADFATYGAAKNWSARVYTTTTLDTGKYVMAAVDANGDAIDISVNPSLFNPANVSVEAINTATTGVITICDTATSTTTVTVLFTYQYDAEAEGQIPEINFKIEEETIKLTRRQLRGKYTVDSAQDLKVLHGINLDSELINMMKNELMHEINHEIVTDLRKMAYNIKTLDFEAFLTTGQDIGAMTAGNYDDAAKVMLDAINRIAAVIWVQGRLGYANWVVGNPATLCYLDRVPGFVGSGVSFNGRDLSFAGSVGGKMKIYHDPTYPEDELLIGYKGSSALEAGYLYCPYLPITATPTLYDPKTGDPSKIFYTRYSKTLKTTGENFAMPKSVILNGQLQYARMKLTNYPASSMFS